MTTAPFSFPEAIRTLITPQLLQSIFTQNIPWAKDTPPSGTDWISYQEKENLSIWQNLCWDPLVAISKLDLAPSNSPTFLSLLPSPRSPSFPTQAFALVVLLDQAPRHLCNSVNERWRNGYFDALALSLSRELRALPPSSRIDNFACWEGQGFSFAHWCILSVFLAAPFAHAEDLAMHENVLVPGTRERRAETERYYDVSDGCYAEELERGLTLDVSEDTLAFSRLAREGMPKTGEIKDCVFWFCRILEAHVPIVRAFGRYPYRNRALGRESTEAEVEFLEKTADFGVGVDEVAARRIREDVERGVWSPLVELGVDD